MGPLRLIKTNKIAHPGLDVAASESLPDKEPHSSNSASVLLAPLMNFSVFLTTFLQWDK